MPNTERQKGQGQEEAQLPPEAQKLWKELDEVVVGFVNGLAEQLGEPEKAEALLTKTSGGNVHRWRVAEDVKEVEIKQRDGHADDEWVERTTVRPEVELTLHSSDFKTAAFVRGLSWVAFTPTDSEEPPKRYAGPSFDDLKARYTLPTPDSFDARHRSVVSSPEKRAEMLDMISKFLTKAWEATHAMADRMPVYGRTVE